jgi:hypothetical protein
VEEIWLEIGFAKKYSVSNYGRVKNNITNTIFRPFDDKDGYERIKIYNNQGKRKAYRVHDLVARCFVGDIPYGMEVDHRDLNRKNNRVDNLRIVTHSENMKNNRARKNRVMQPELELV